ncbi:MAG TPA: hypothetical protein VGG03_16660 [Thermoanaerobaculia bacterium]
MSLPAGTRRLFSGYDEADLTPERGGSLLIARLLEDGDAADLAWLLSNTSEPALADWLARHGGRKLSRRSRAFWEAVLGVAAAPARPEAEALWPL